MIAGVRVALGWVTGGIKEALEFMGGFMPLSGINEKPKFCDKACWSVARLSAETCGLSAIKRTMLPRLSAAICWRIIPLFEVRGIWVFGSKVLPCLRFPDPVLSEGRIFELWASCAGCLERWLADVFRERTVERLCSELPWETTV